MDSIIRLSRSADLEGLSTEGGPIVLVPREVVAIWNEVDYESACSVQDWIGIVQKHAVPVLVLGAEPTLTWWQPALDPPEVKGILFRWIEAPENFEPPQLIELSKCVEVEDKIFVDYPSQTTLLMFDAALNGEDAIEEELFFNLSPTPQHLEVSTFEYKPSDDLSLILHVLSDRRGK